jgi:hypothetical protein
MTGELIRTITVKGLAEDGVGTEVTTLRITLTEEGYEVDYLLNGNVVDGFIGDTRAEAEQQAREWAIDAHREYQEEARERIAEARRERREAINEVASDLTGDDARALRMVAALIGQGRASAAVAALRALRGKRQGEQ